MTARLPVPGSDDNQWGNILNTFLSVSLNTDGTLAPSAVTAAGAGTYSKPVGGIPSTDLSSSVQTNLTKASSALQSAPVTSVAGMTGAVALNEDNVASTTTSGNSLSDDLAALQAAITNNYNLATNAVGAVQWDGTGVEPTAPSYYAFVLYNSAVAPQHAPDGSLGVGWS